MSIATFMHLDTWRAHAACADFDPAIFFPTRNGGEADAKAICATCPVVDACRDFAIREHIPCGVFGGMNERERQNYQRRQRRHRAPVHGTAERWESGCRCFKCGVAHAQEEAA